MIYSFLHSNNLLMLVAAALYQVRSSPIPHCPHHSLYVPSNHYLWTVLHKEAVLYFHVSIKEEKMKKNGPRMLHLSKTNGKEHIEKKRGTILHVW